MCARQAGVPPGLEVLFFSSPSLPLKIPELIDQGHKVTAALDSSTLGAHTGSAEGSAEGLRGAPPAGTRRAQLPPGLGAGHDYTAQTSCSSDLTRVHAR